jgi:hypothetical protein
MQKKTKKNPKKGMRYEVKAAKRNNNKNSEKMST